jgi:hypothetical protein
MKFAQRALREAPYLALLLQDKLSQEHGTVSVFPEHQSARVWISSRRLPMMHRHGWQAAVHPATPALPDSCAIQKRVIDWFDWKAITSNADREDLFEFAERRLRAVA